MAIGQFPKASQRISPIHSLMKSYWRSIGASILLTASLLNPSAKADVSLPKVLGDHMVLQRDQSVPIWGKAAPGEQVTVHFGSQEKKTQASPSGDWMVKLDPMTASSSPATLSIVGANKIDLTDILIGEVWLCSGQSNMEFPMQPVGNFSSRVQTLPPLSEGLAAANHPNIRLFRVEKKLNQTEVTTDGWTPCSPTTAAKFSAIGYFYGKELQDQLHVPIGLMQAAWGGTRIEPWTPPQAYESSPLFKAQAATSQPVTIDGARAGTHYSAMVRPLVPYAIRGAIWYQGESNIIATNDGDHYFDKFKVLVDSWRAAWGQGDFPFYFAQLAPYTYTKRTDPMKHTPQDLPMLWEAQVMSLKLANTGMAATIDLSPDFGDIHPPDKWTVGHRFALIALSNVYKVPGLVISGPQYRWVEFRDGKARVRFDYSDGLKSRDGQSLNTFEVAGRDRKFVPAKAIVDGTTILVSSEQVPLPEEVRFGWSETAQPNLVNGDGLPAIPFRTDR